jgi:hypothetical protein
MCCSLLFFLASCLGDGDNYSEDNFPDDAELLSFKLSHDSIPELGTKAFTIDQKRGLIYNHDSLPYQTVIDRVVTVTYTNSTSISNVLLVSPDPDNDSIRWIASGDTLDVSQPFYFKVYSYDGLKTKLYKGQVYIHQIDPDSVQYRRIAAGQSFLDNPDLKAITFGGKYYIYARAALPPSSGIPGVDLYQSDDAIAWTKVESTAIPANLVVSGIVANDAGVYGYTDTGNFYVSFDALNWEKIREIPTLKQDYPVKAILGFLKDPVIQRNGLPLEGFSLIVEKNDESVFAFTSNGEDWEYGTDPIPGNFPVSGFSTINYESGYQQCISLVGGISLSGEVLATVWSLKDDLLNWANLSEQKFPKLQGANAFLYDNEFYLLNGQLESGSYNSEVYYSRNKGLTWEIKPEKYFPPKD